jgi:hypothetical protein
MDKGGGGGDLNGADAVDIEPAEVGSARHGVDCLQAISRVGKKYWRGRMVRYEV